jgi:biotin transport system substrate-specific component
VRNSLLAVSASIFVAVCAHVAVPLPFSPVPFTLQNFAVLLVGLALGPLWGAAALFLYLAEGAAGLPVFQPLGPGGIAQLLGHTGGYLLAYPAVAFIAGLVRSRAEGAVTSGLRRFLVSFAACTAAEIILFACGVSWLALYTHSLSKAVLLGIIPFLPLEAVKIALASLAGTRLHSR